MEDTRENMKEEKQVKQDNVGNTNSIIHNQNDTSAYNPDLKKVLEVEVLDI